MNIDQIRQLSLVDELNVLLTGVGYFEIEKGGESYNVGCELPDLGEFQLVNADGSVNVRVRAELTSDVVDTLPVPAVIMAEGADSIRQWVQEAVKPESGTSQWTERGNNLFRNGSDICAIRLHDGFFEIINWNEDNYPQLQVSRGRDTLTRAERSKKVQEECAGWTVVKNNSFDLRVNSDGEIMHEDEIREADEAPVELIQTFLVEGVYKDNHQIFDGEIEATSRTDAIRQAEAMGLVSIDVKGVK